MKKCISSKPDRKKIPTIGRGRRKLIRNLQNWDSAGGSPRIIQSQATTGPLIREAENMTDEEVDRVIEDTRVANTESHITDKKERYFKITIKTPSNGRKKKTLEQKR